MGKKTGLITLLFLFFFLNGFSQPVADFTADVTEGCESIIVNFTDLSTGATTWHWNFGNGNSSSSQNPTAIYNNGGSTDLVFDVTLIVSNGSISDTLVMEDFITVFALPTAYFQATTDTAGCTPLVVSFQDQSTPAESPIVTWEWTLGTGATSSVQHPTQTYVTPGYYTVLLKVTDDNGCISNYSINNYIYVSDIPEAGFTVNSTADCSAPLTVEFMDTSHTGTGQQIDYLWYFGDGDTSALQNPQHTYQNNGTYDVALVVSNEYGCADSVMFMEYIQIVPIDVSFSASADPGCPYIPVTFTVTTTNATEFSWDFGDGQQLTNTQLTTSHTYTAPGSYIVTMIASIGAACQDTLHDTIAINEIIADFVADDLYGCDLPFQVNFTDLSTNAASWQWLFHYNSGSNYTSTEQNPSPTFNTGGVIDAQLIVTDSIGCKDTLLMDDYIVIEPLTLTIAADNIYGCSPLATCFTSTVTSQSPVSAYNWLFYSDVVPDTSHLENPCDTFEYNDFLHNLHGEIDVILTVTNDSGCVETADMSVYVGIPPTTVHYIFSDSTGTIYLYDSVVSCDTGCFVNVDPPDDPCPDCGTITYYACAWPDSVQYFDSSFVTWNGQNYPRDEYIDEWFWDFGEENATSGDEDPYYWYDDTTGYMTIELITGYNHCYDTIRTDSLVYIDGPVIHPIVDATFSCDSSYVYTFYVEFVDADTIAWNFNHDSIFDTIIGFPADTSLIDTITYDFAINDSTGDYWAVFYASNSFTGCESKDSVFIQVRDIHSEFQTDTLKACPGQVIYMNADSCREEEVSQGYRWNFGDNPNWQTTYVPATSHSYTNPGVYTISLVVTDINGCRDTSRQSVRIYKPYPGFICDTLRGCTPLSINFTDTSLFDTTIVSWVWSYVGLTTGSTFSDTLTASDTVEITFPVNDSYTVTLYVTDTLGCEASTSVTVLSHRPTPYLYAVDTTICAGDSVQIRPDLSIPSYSYTFSDLTFSWIFDSITSSENNVYVTYPDSGYHSGTLTVHEDGCDSTITTDSILHVQQLPEADFYAIPTDTTCFPAGIDFFNTTVHYDSDYYSVWNFGDGSGGSSDENPHYAYTQPGDYTVTLVITTSAEYGCTNTIVREEYIHIEGPLATFGFTPNLICRGDTVTFYIIDSSNVQGWLWDFGTGETSSEAPVNYQYIDIAEYQFTPQATYWSEDGCEQTYTLGTLNIHEVIAAFQIDDTTGNPASTGCEPLMLAFTDNSTSNTTIATWQWDFTESVSADQNPVNIFDTAGTYPVRLVIQSATGCTDTATSQVVVYPTPEVTVSPDTIICESTTATLTGNSVYSVHWTPEDGLNSPNSSTTIAAPDSTTTYTYTVTDANGCVDSTTTTVTVYYQYELDYTDYYEINIGDFVDLPVTASPYEVMYTWSPDYMLSCLDCNSPVAQPRRTTDYIIYTIDSAGCHDMYAHIRVLVDSTLGSGVPMVFTPNGDNINDMVYFVGVGVEELYEFSIYNRWGEKLFTTEDMNEGWDGTHNGKLQNIDTYIWKAVYKYLDRAETIEETGNVTLLR